MKKSMLFLVVALAFTFALFTGTVMADKTVTVVLSEEPDNIDPCSSCRSNIGRVVLKNIAEPFTEIDPKDGSVTPRLAESWKQIDPNTWQFSLRKGVKFHDGEDFNAQAAIFAINRTMNTGIECENRIKYFSGVEMTLKAVDSHTLEIKTDTPQPILPTLFGTMTIMSPKTPTDKLTRNPVGTGPYKFVKWDVGKQIIVERFDGYWGNQPQAEKGIYMFRSESAVRAAMVATGEADIAPNIAVQDANNPDMDYSFFNSETSRFRIQMEKPPFNDIRVRQALNYAIDRDAIRGSILSKDVMPSTQLVVPSINGHNPNLKVWPYDPEKAKKLLDEARKDGVPVDKEITLYGRTGIYPNATELMEAALAMYQAIGLNVKLKMLEVGVWIKILNKPYAEDWPPIILQAQHDNNNGDAVFTVFYKYHSNGPNSVINDKTLDGLIEKATAATGDERTKLWHQAFKRINDDIIADVPLFHMVGYTRVGKRIDYKPSIATNSELQLAQITFK